MEPLRSQKERAQYHRCVAVVHLWRDRLPLVATLIALLAALIDLAFAFSPLKVLVFLASWLACLACFWQRPKKDTHTVLLESLHVSSPSLPASLWFLATFRVRTWRAKHHTKKEHL